VEKILKNVKKRKKRDLKKKRKKTFVTSMIIIWSPCLSVCLSVSVCSLVYCLCMFLYVHASVCCRSQGSWSSCPMSRYCYWVFPCPASSPVVASVSPRQVLTGGLCCMNCRHCRGLILLQVC